MISRLITLTLACVAIVFSIASCSTGDGQILNPSIPPVTETQTVNPDSGRCLWTYMFVYVDPDGENGLEYEIIPARLVESHWNALKWLEQGPCTDCFKIVGITPTGTGTIECEIEVSHPFDNPNLTGFDVRGIAMFAGSENFPTLDVTLPDRTLGDGELVNVDGYTTLYNYSTLGSGPGGLQGYIPGKFEGQPPTATLNGFKRHFSFYPDNTRNAFYAGDAVTVTYEVDMPDGAFVFGYAVDANWVTATTLPVVDPMTDFPGEANCPEPWKLDVVDSAVGQGLTDLGNDYNIMTITVWDYVGESSLQSPRIECPALFDGTVSASYVIEGSGWTEYQAEINNPKHAASGEYRCVVKVEDNENSGSPEWLDLSAYQTYTLQVNAFGDDLPVAMAVAEPNPQTVCEPVNFTDDGSYDPDGGDIVLFEWDWDDDGVWDETGDSADYIWNTPGTYPVQLRVTDDEGSKDTLDAPIDVVVQNALPTAVADVDKTIAGIGEAIEFDGTLSSDNDCSGQEIVLWEWDWENDGVWDTEAGTTQHVYNEIGIYEVQLRVTDDEGGTDTLDAPIEITVIESTWAITLGATGRDIAYDTDTDSDGNVYIVGECFLGVDFDPGPGETDPSQSGAYIAKYDTNGNYLWHHVFHSASTYNQFKGVFVDSSDNVYMLGRFSQTIDFDPGDGVHEHTCNGYCDVILLKLNSAGNYLWSRSFGGDWVDSASSLCVTGSYIYIVGTFEGTVDFDPFGGGEFRTGLGNQDCFLSVLNLSGVLQWVNTWGGPDAVLAYGDTARDVVADSFGNVYVTGGFFGTCDFDPSGNTVNRTATGEMDAYLVSYTTSGAFSWVNAWGSDSNYEVGFGVDVDTSGYVYVGGRFEDTVDFDTGPGEAYKTSQGWYDAFLVQYDWNGDFGWVASWGSVTSLSREQIFDVEVNTSGIIHVCGTFENTVDFDTGPGHSDFTSAGAEDVFVMTLSTDSTFQWAQGWGGDDVDGDWAWSVNYDPDGNAFVSGEFNGTADFDPGVDTDYRVSQGQKDLFLSKFLDDGTW